MKITNLAMNKMKLSISLETVVFDGVMQNDNEPKNISKVK